MSGFRAPTATYRLQFGPDFKFAAAQALVPYLDELGITDIYASPLFKARKGSLHGYSVANPMELNPELGSKRAFDTLAQRLKSRGLGLVFDIVPNHMALSPDNPWWMEVLESGPSSPYAIFFDIDWHPPNRLLEGVVLLPVLGRPFGEALEEQELRLTLEEGGLFLNYYDHKFPLDPKTYRRVMAHRLDELAQALGEEHPEIISLRGLLSIINHLPVRTLSSPKKARERQRDKEIIKKNLWLMYQRSPEIKKFLDENLEIFNGQKGEPASFDLLDQLLGRQPYRLAFWKVALEMINYRRFFSINDLIGIRLEDPKVFEAFKHSLIFKLVDEGKVSGIRIDHLDGLYDPLGYLQGLQERLAQEGEESSESAHFYIIAEKILAQNESLPPEWPLAGTTGYDFLNMANGLFVAGKGLQKLEEIYARWVDSAQGFEEVVRDKKKMIMATLFGGEVENQGYYLNHLATQDRQARDIARSDLIAVLVEVTAALPVYRTYIRSFEVAPRDRSYLEIAIASVRRRHPGINQVALEFLRRVLLLQFPPYLTEEQRRDWLEFVLRWQQFTPPVMAKGLEDTALYVYNPLLSLNEVGTIFRAVTAEAFHAFNRQRREFYPYTLNATSTHDTKRSEDVRARLNVLSEIPGDWEACLHRWRDWNRSAKVVIQGEPVPDANQEIILYQTLLGAWPLSRDEIPSFQERLKGYLVKAAREAMAHTRWVSPDVEHEGALLQFLDIILEDTRDNNFLKDFLVMHERLSFFGALNSLSQVLLKIASPGVPDFYQGTELLDFSLVDPDNRRPVDFRQREQLLRNLKVRGRQDRGGLLAELLAGWQDSRLKLYVTHLGLNFRKNSPELFLQGDYLPLAAGGAKQNHVIAFARRRGKDWAIAAAARFFTRLARPGEAPVGRKVWGEGALALPPKAPEQWVDIFTGETVAAEPSAGVRGLPLAKIFRRLPVALLSTPVA
jgi:(1->4)-alpha-D-glucan 1-alpha-D-glucosylmutase